MVGVVVLLFLVLHTDLFHSVVAYYFPPDETLRVREKRFPSAIVAGVRMCGTRALIEFMKLHTWLEFPTRQLHFFDNETMMSQGVDWYRQQMPGSLSNQLTIDPEPHYFSDELAPQRIATTMNNTVKIILIFCSPSIRTVTWYNEVIANDVTRNKEDTTIDKIVLDNSTGEVDIHCPGVKEGFYDKHMQRWFTYFNKSSVHIVNGDMFTRNPIGELRKIERFLKVPARIREDQLEYNPDTGLYCARHTKPAISPTGEPSTVRECIVQKDHFSIFKADISVIKKLFEFFRPLNEHFYKTIGQKFDWAYQTYSNKIDKTLKLHIASEEEV